MTGKGSQRKGAKGERELAAQLTDLLGVEARKGSSPFLPGLIAPDVLGVPGIHVESKRREKVGLPSALRQAREDARPGDVATVAHRPSRCPWMLTLYLDDLPALAEAVHSLLHGGHR